MKTHVVKYPGSIERALLTMEDMKKYRAYSIVSKVGLPEGTLFDAVGVMNEEEFGHTSFTILLPSGEAFTGFAVKRYGDTNDPDAANCIAAGRALAVWRAQEVIKAKLEIASKSQKPISFRVINEPTGKEAIRKLAGDLAKITWVADKQPRCDAKERALDIIRNANIRNVVINTSPHERTLIVTMGKELTQDFSGCLREIRGK